MGLACHHVHEDAGVLHRAMRRPARVVAHVRVAAIGEHVRDVLPRQWAQHQAFGLQRRAFHQKTRQAREPKRPDGPAHFGQARPATGSRRRRARLPNAAGAPSRRTPAPACPRTSRRTPGRCRTRGSSPSTPPSPPALLPRELQRLGRPGHERVRAVGPVRRPPRATPARQARSRTADGEPAALPTLRGTREPACGARPTPPRPRTASPSRRSGTVRLAGRRSRQCSWGRLLSRRPPF